jgi:endonuclease/exonuclease/phosphatase family metal-dependent hydrolase
MARVIQAADADLVVLNEVDFASHWSGGLNQGEILARVTGYRNRVEQRNFDIRLPGLSFVFGNVLLSRYPVIAARYVKLPAYSTLESLMVGAKAAALVTVETPQGPLAVVPVHLEFREGNTRMRAAGTLQGLRQNEPAPTVLAGDFNTAPSGWPGGEGRTLLDSLLALGWGSPRAEGPPDPRAFTFPTKDPRDARDWVLSDPTLRVREVRVLHQAGPLSDHAPVLSVLELPGKTSREETGEHRN